MIKTVDVVKQTGSVDLSLLTSLIEITEYQFTGFSMLYDIVKDVMDSSVVDAGLENVDFRIDSPDFVYDIRDQTGRLGDVAFIGEDKEYRYFSTVKMLYEGDDDEDEEDEDFDLVDEEDILDEGIPELESPEQVIVTIIRINKKQPLNVSNFNFDNKTWDMIDVCKEFGYTKNQAKMIINNRPEDRLKILLTMLYRDIYGNISDSEFQELYTKTKPLLDLCEKAYDNYGIDLSLDVLDNKDKELGLAFTPDCTGAVVTYSNGKFQMHGCILGKSLFTAFETDNMGTISTWIQAMHATSASEEYIGIFPLSNEAFATVTVDNEIQYSYFDKREDGKMTDEEETVLKMFLEKLDEVFDDGED